MPPNCCNSWANEKMSRRRNQGDSLASRIIMTLGSLRAGVIVCRQCQTRLTCDARVIRFHLQHCVSSQLVTIANSSELLGNRGNNVDSGSLSNSTSSSAVVASTSSVSK